MSQLNNNLFWPPPPPPLPANTVEAIIRYCCINILTHTKCKYSQYECEKYAHSLQTYIIFTPVWAGFQKHAEPCRLRLFLRLFPQTKEYLFCIISDMNRLWEMEAHPKMSLGCPPPQSKWPIQSVRPALTFWLHVFIRIKTGCRGGGKCSTCAKNTKNNAVIIAL